MPEFADFDEHPGQRRWHDLVLRAYGPEDAARCAELLAAREAWPLERASEEVVRWDGAHRQNVVVAEHHGRVAAYGKTVWLSPQVQGGNGPTGWYLAGVVVAPEARRHGIGLALTRERIRLLRGITPEVWYFVNAGNRASIAMHDRLGFVLHTTDFAIPGVSFRGGVGALYRLELDGG